jgi:hypothetical protein
MAEYTLSLALVDFLPVLFTAVGFAYVIRLVSSVLPAQGRIAFLGGLLVVAGGFLQGGLEAVDGCLGRRRGR